MRLIGTLLVSAVAGWLLWAYVHPHTPPKRFAPDGTFFLLERVSKQVETGVYALAPGTEVHRVSEDGALLIVSDGRETFELTAPQLTNDLDVAAALVKSESENRQHFESALERQNRELSEKKKREFIENARRMEEHERARQAAAAAGQPNALQRGAYDQKESVVGKVLYIDKNGHRFWVDPLGNRHYVP